MHKVAAAKKRMLFGSAMLNSACGGERLGAKRPQSAAEEGAVARATGFTMPVTCMPIRVYLVFTGESAPDRARQAPRASPASSLTTARAKYST